MARAIRSDRMDTATGPIDPAQAAQRTHRPAPLSRSICLSISFSRLAVSAAAGRRAVAATSTLRATNSHALVQSRRAHFDGQHTQRAADARRRSSGSEPQRRCHCHDCTHSRTVLPSPCLRACVCVCAATVGLTDEQKEFQNVALDFAKVALSTPTAPHRAALGCSDSATGSMSAVQAFSSLARTMRDDMMRCDAVNATRAAHRQRGSLRPWN